jgi:hypothetical protein
VPGVATSRGAAKGKPVTKAKATKAKAKAPKAKAKAPKPKAKPAKAAKTKAKAKPAKAKAKPTKAKAKPAKATAKPTKATPTKAPPAANGASIRDLLTVDRWDRWGDGFSAASGHDAWPDGLDDASFLLLLRPFCWFVPGPMACQDLLEECGRARDLLAQHQALLADTLIVSGLPRFLAAYVDEQVLDSTGWFFLAADIELAASIDLDTAAKRLRKKHKADAAALAALAVKLKDIVGAKHEVYNRLRSPSLGLRFVHVIEQLIHTLSPPDQGYLLHALDGHSGERPVIAFYKNFIARTASDQLRDEASTYLARVAA